jgi:hypothetical protein
MKVLVCGGRDFNNYDFLEHALNEISKEVGGITFIVNGACEGADKQSSKWAEAHGIHYAEMPALWKYNGKAAGPKRNKAMIEFIDLDIVVAFPGGNGTADMVKLGHGHDLEVVDLRDTNVGDGKDEESEFFPKWMEPVPDNMNYDKIVEELKKRNADIPNDDKLWNAPYNIPTTRPDLPVMSPTWKNPSQFQKSLVTHMESNINYPSEYTEDSD